VGQPVDSGNGDSQGVFADGGAKLGSPEMVSTRTLKHRVLPEDFRGSALKDLAHEHPEDINSQRNSGQSADPNRVYQLFYSKFVQNKSNDALRAETHQTSQTLPKDEAQNETHRLCKGSLNHLRVFADDSGALKTTGREPKSNSSAQQFVRLENSLENRVLGVPTGRSMCVLDSERDPFELNDYVTFPSDSVYNSPGHLLNLKACCLLNKGTLFENDIVRIDCSADCTVTDSAMVVSYVLTYTPKGYDLTLSTEVDSRDSFFALPAHISNKHFSLPLSQIVSIRFHSKPHLVDFPTLQFTIASPDKVQSLPIHLPFSVNRFFSEITDTAVINRIVNKVQSLGSVVRGSFFRNRVWHSVCF
jgi:hypothetical protein